MIKKIMMMVIALVMLTGLTACGTRAMPKKVNTLSVTELSETKDGKTTYFPVSVTTMEEDGEKLIVKNYEVPQDVNPFDLVEEPFERSKYQYEVRDILRKTSEPKYEKKIVSKQIEVKSNSNDMNKVLKQAPVIIDYDEEGYKGQLIMNPTNLFTESTGTKSYSYTVKETKTYNDLARNDMAFIKKTTVKDGVELTLADVDWTANRTALVGNTLIDSSYNAVAYYTGTGYGSRSTGYSTTITYLGEASKEVDGHSTISVIYHGNRVYNILLIVLICIGVIVVIMGIILTIWVLRRKEEPEDDNSSNNIPKVPNNSSDIAVERTKESIALNTALKEAEQREAREHKNEPDAEKSVDKPKKPKEKVKVYVQEDSGNENKS